MKQRVITEGYPRWMMVFDQPEQKKRNRLVIAEFEGNEYKYRVVSGGDEEFYLKGEDFDTDTFRYAEEIKEPLSPQEWFNNQIEVGFATYLNGCDLVRYMEKYQEYLKQFEDELES
jgi:hypothetical protein